ncbi:hypothetical protein BH11CYA1_BH11CYA1_42160 [soil metagenome]
MLRFSKLLCILVAAAPIFSIFTCTVATASTAKEQPKAIETTKTTRSRRPYLSARSAYLRQLVNPQRKQNLGVAYFIELNRAGRVFKTNNKTKFRSGDQIRFHAFANSDAYIYIVMRKGTLGTKSVLFPLAATGTNNLVKRGQDCIVPTESALQFDENPGIENVGLLLSRQKIDSASLLNYPKNLTAYISSAPNKKQAKLPSRTKISVERARNGALLKSFPASTSGMPPLALLSAKDKGRQLWLSASAALRESNMVVVVNEGQDIVSIDFSLIHEL